MNQKNIEIIFEKKNQKNVELKKKFIEWSSVSTSHGYPNIFRTKHTSVKILWAICLVVSISLCLFLLIRGIKAFLEFDVVTSIKTVEERPALFPSITICDIKKFKSDASADLFKDIYLTKYGINLTEDNFYSKNVSSLYNNVIDLATAIATNPGYGDTNRKKLGFKLDEILGGCSFNNKECNITDFKYFWDYNYGNCYTFNIGFNSSGDAVPLKYSYKPGYFDGLSIELFFEEKEYMFSNVFNQGATLFIHNNTHKPIFSNGIEILTGNSVNIGIKKTLTHKYPDPYSDCKDLSSVNSYFYDILTQSNKSYRQSDCFELLLQRNVIKNCSCYDLQFPQLYNATPCLNLTQIGCASDQYFSFWDENSNTFTSECPLECESVDFDFTYSISDLDIERFYINRFYQKPNEDVDLASLKKRVVDIYVYFTQLKYTEITEMPTTTVIDLLASVGGTIGLFVGISVLSFVEIIEFIMESIFIYLEKRKDDEV
jgi:acid-sensing ion channel 5